MAEMFVMCPECGLRAKLTRNDAQIVGAEGKCNHRDNPISCPILGGQLAAIQQVLKESEQPTRDGGNG
jgi:hypothetical protein